MGNPPNLEIRVYQISTESIFPILRDLRNPSKVFTFDSSSFTANEEKICNFSIDVDTLPSTEGISFPQWMFILFSLPSGYEIEDRDYYTLRWVTGGWGYTSDMIENFAVNRIEGNPIVPVVGGSITYSDETEYWATTPGSVFKYPIGDSKIILLGGKSIERSFQNYAFDDYWGILMRFAGSALVDMYYNTNPNPIRRVITSFRNGFTGEAIRQDEINQYAWLFANTHNWLLYAAASGYGNGGPLFIDQSPPTGANITKLKFTALSPYVHLSEIILAGKDNQFWITKKITDYDPASTSITDYGLCPDPDSGKEKEFSSKVEMEEYIKNILLTQSDPQFSLTLDYPDILVPSLPSTFNITIPEIQIASFSQKVIGCEWDLDTQSTTLFFETAPLNYIIQALKTLKENE